MDKVIVLIGAVSVFFSMQVFSQTVEAQELYHFANMQQEAQFGHLLKDLRCLVCQNQDLSDSHAPLAKDLKKLVYEMVLDGKSDADITEFLTERYGDFVLFNPPVKPLTYALWAGPLVFLLMGLFVFFRTCRRQVR